MKTNDQILSNLSAAAGPYIATAEAERGYQVQQVRVRTGDDLLVEFTHRHGVDRMVAAGAEGDALARAAGDVLESGLNNLPVPARQNVATLHANGAQLVVVFDPVFSSAEVVVVTADANVSLATLVSGDVH